MPEKLFYTFLISLGYTCVILGTLDKKYKYVTFGAVCLWAVIISAICWIWS